jgi:NAD(P)-dependent dehydrogenase (short-subunit alcohol dehydrogenase family)
MRILQMLPQLQSGGVETGTLDLAKAFKKMGHEVFVMSSGGELVRELVTAGIQHVTLPIHAKSLTALFMVTREVLRVMIPQKEGSIINVSSGVGRIGKARWGAYAASKFGVEGFTQVLADEVKAVNIRVNAVNPGGTRTQMRTEAYPEEDPLTLPTPEEIAGVFLYLASAESGGVTGRSFDARDWLRQSVDKPGA